MASPGKGVWKLESAPDSGGHSDAPPPQAMALCVHLAHPASRWSSLGRLEELPTGTDTGFRRSELGDFPGGLAAKTPSLLCRAPGFDPWSGNWMPHASTKIPRVTTTEKMLRAAAKTRCSQKEIKEGSEPPPSGPGFPQFRTVPLTGRLGSPTSVPLGPGPCRPPCPEERAPQPESGAPGWVWSRASGARPADRG